MKRIYTLSIALLVGCMSVAAVAGAANSLDVNAGAAMGPNSSQFGLELILQDPASSSPNQAWVMADETKGFNDETTLKGSFFLGPLNLTMAQTMGQNHFQMLVLVNRFGTQAASAVPVIFFLQRDAAGGNWFLTAWHYNENINNWQFSGNGFLANYGGAFFAENLIEFEWTAGNPGNLKAWRTVWRNGAPDPSGRIQMFDVPLPGQANATVNKVVAGMWSSHDPGTFGSLFFDEFVFTR